MAAYEEGGTAKQRRSWFMKYPIGRLFTYPPWNIRIRRRSTREYIFHFDLVGVYVQLPRALYLDRLWKSNSKSVLSIFFTFEH